MKIFDGVSEAKKLDEKIAAHISQNPPTKSLAIIQIGDNPSSEKYIQVKKRLGERLGIDVILHKFGAEIDDLELGRKVKEIFDDSAVGGVIVQLPLPRPSLNKILALIPIEKDIDALSEGPGVTYTSPVIRACEHFIYSIGSDLKEKKAIIIGGGKLVGNPIASYLKNRGWEVGVDENYSRGKMLKANLIVLSAGIPNLVSGNDISENSNVVDFGSAVINGQTIGDLDMKSALSHLNLLSPSPGGMGPLTVRYLFMNFLNL